MLIFKNFEHESVPVLRSLYSCMDGRQIYRLFQVGQIKSDMGAAGTIGQNHGLQEGYSGGYIVWVFSLK